MSTQDLHPSQPPEGPWVMIQEWHDLLFAHWRCPTDDLRPLIPAPLEIDTFDGSAWISVTPFYMRGVRMRMAPPVPTATAFEELNVRTYVTLDGRPGIWFFSLDCASSLAVVGARIGIYLPYFRATMKIDRQGDQFSYRSERWPIAGKPAAFAASYQPIGVPYHSVPGTIDHFLTERYSLYSAAGKRIWRGDIYHSRWNLQPAAAQFHVNSMIAAAGIRHVGNEPLLQFSEFMDVRIWWPVRVR